MKTVFIIDDPPLPESLRPLLESEGYEVRQYENANDFLDSLRPTTAGCILADIRMPDMSGLDFLKEMRERHYRLPVIIVTEEADVRSAVADEKRDELSARFAALTEREKQVLERVLDGQPTKIIASELGISPRTVEVHRANVMSKTKAKNLADLVRLSLRSGIIGE